MPASKLILAALAEGPWTEEDSQSQVGRLRLFLRLGLTDKDGWLQPRSMEEMPAAAQKWLRDHAAAYRIQRYVPEPASKNPNKIGTRLASARST